MFRYFPTNYVWNLSVDLAIEMGAKIGEIEEMCAPLREAAKQPDAAGTAAFRETWAKMGDKLCGLAEEDEATRSADLGRRQIWARGDLLSDRRAPAGARSAGAPRPVQAHADVFDRGVRLADENCERVEIPYGETHLSALCTRAEGVDGPRAAFSSSSMASIRRRR